ncbi:peptidoglycan DD-metalloendopeptidase family protein [Lutibacter sp.]|uniref:murein hydrolase activator EnvC family protein n=1 Tax=Lutibacter sp. TaxID=1925666 RepID=UPI001A2D6DBC|nr:peptidoglycan DD-metalloendopeptidase family protein [Lutibacter sp.]MBI9040814.1 peptidoglycan DD-metalloendopeptidase family protein [Lutibacter sp.]
MQFKIYFPLLFIALFFSVNSQSQNSKRQQLESRRTQIQKDIIYINALLSNTKKKESNLLSDVKDLKHKIKAREELISVISSESKELNNEIYVNQLEINKNKRDLEALKKDYADMIFKSYQSKSQNSRIMFLLSSENFFQAYKRFQYMKQYTSFRKKQGEEILIKTTKLQALTDTLKIKKDQKTALLNEKKKEQTVIEKEKKEQENLLSQVKKKEGDYKKQIQKFQKEEERIDAQIDKLIRDAIAASNRKAGETTSSTTTTAGTSSKATFTLTAEAKELASKFTSNKGSLPWPVEKGFVSTYYGKQPHPIVSSATIQSNGVRITTEAGSKARAVFEGTVLAIQVMSGNQKAVLIQHGNYITVYKNLENVYVHTGDKVSTKQEIGNIFTDRITGKTILGFILSKNTDTENPATWIYKM